MCRKATCESCNKTTWFGCGRHVSGVMDSVPHEQWCTCDPKIEREGAQYPPMVGTKSPKDMSV